jgi:hypothetical protein
MESTEAVTPGRPTREVVVFMPSGGWMDEYYRQLIQPTLEEAGYACRLGKDVYSKCNPKDEIIDRIQQAQVVLCWMTGRDPGVMYAFGVAQALGTQIVLITDSAAMEDIPIGVRGLAWIEIQQANPRWGVHVSGGLVKALAAIPSPQCLD